MSVINSIAQTQYQMSDELYYSILEYMDKKGLTVEELCEKNNWDCFLFTQVFDRTIKMHIYPSYLFKIAATLSLKTDNITMEQPSKVLIYNDADNKRWVLDHSYQYIKPRFRSHLKKYMEDNAIFPAELAYRTNVPYSIIKYCLMGEYKVPMPELRRLARCVNYYDTVYDDTKN